MKVGIIMGGVSSERDVSLMTGQEMIKNLDRKYQAVPIVLNSKAELIDKVKGIDVALLALHGAFGEDGTIQGTLDTLGIPYTGSGILSSSLCMNKLLTKKIVKCEGFATADWLLMQAGSAYDADQIGAALGFPLVIKPNAGGSSIGVKLVHHAESLETALQEAFSYDTEILIEQYIQGDEITCSILNGQMLPVLSIKPKGEFFDYSSKYEDGGADEVVIELPESILQQVRRTALGVYEAVQCSVYARIDMILHQGVPYVIEVNTLPGLTKNSLLPKSAKAAGISYSELLTQIIEISLQEHTRHPVHGELVK